MLIMLALSCPPMRFPILSPSAAVRSGFVGCWCVALIHFKNAINICCPPESLNTTKCYWWQRDIAYGVTPSTLRTLCNYRCRCRDCLEPPCIVPAPLHCTFGRSLLIGYCQAHQRQLSACSQWVVHDSTVGWTSLDDGFLGERNFRGSSMKKMEFYVDPFVSPLSFSKFHLYVNFSILVIQLWAL